MTYIADKTSLDGVLLLRPQVFEDPRGSFFESFNQNNFEETTGSSCHFVQDNHSFSHFNVLRGLHYQIERSQGKLIRVISGQIFDVCVNIQPEHPQFLQWFGVRLTAAEKLQVWIPPGFAHGFLTLSESAEVLYKSTDYYSPSHDRCIAWNDPDIGVKWPTNKHPTLSQKDASAPTAKQAELPLTEKKFFIPDDY